MSLCRFLLAYNSRTTDLRSLHYDSVRLHQADATNDTNPIKLGMARYIRAQLF